MVNMIQSYDDKVGKQWGYMSLKDHVGESLISENHVGESLIFTGLTLANPWIHVGESLAKSMIFKYTNYTFRNVEIST